MTSVSMESQIPPEKVEAARDQAEQAAARAGVVIVELVTPEQATAAAVMLDAIWNRERGGAAPMEPGLLVALEHAGNYTAGAYLDGRLVGVTAGFFGPPAQSMMHSHIAGVSDSAVGRGVGAAMKLHQRQWCLERGVSTMEWTFDPLILRNASFNLNKLGARLEEYLPQFYGEMRDATNAGQGSDRALVRWHLTRISEPVEEAGEARDTVHMCLDLDGDGAPVHSPMPDDGVIGLRVPPDIESMRTGKPDLSARWRRALRDTMHPLVEAGWSVRGIRGDGTYVLRR